MLQKIKPELIKIFVFLGLSWLLINVTSRFYQHDDKNEDVYYIYLEGKRIIDGENPYERILEGDMRINKKYPTYFPLFYLFAAGTQLIGFREFDQWIVLWRTINILIGILITWLVLNGLSKRAGLLAGILGAVFWQFHALSLYVFEVAHIDFLAIFFLLWSLIELDKNPVRSMILLGISGLSSR